MRVIWLVFVVALAALLSFRYYQHTAPAPGHAQRAAAAPAIPAVPVRLAGAPQSSPPALPAPATPRRDSVVRSALQLRGTAYCYAGTTPASGFDCSGFVQYVFGLYHVPLPHSTALLIAVGRPVPRAEARPGDVVVFTGTAKTSATPGHAGIVVAAGASGPLRFVHSSSARRESGVKISQVEGSDYERRFMQVRRVLPE